MEEDMSSRSQPILAPNAVEACAFECADLVIALLPHALPEGGWRPIESAPRDGTWIMLSRPFWTVPFVGRWTTSKHGEGWHDDNVDEGPLLSPMTHWQPLPPPPTVSREGA
jgi:hypothetical protein